MKSQIEEKRCELCNKPYHYKYKLFGRGCINNIYNQLDIKRPKYYIGNKENYLLTKIAHLNHKYFLSKSKKQALAEMYIALNYLNKMNLNSLSKIKNDLIENMKSISIFHKKFSKFLPGITLNDFYNVYNDYIEFNQKLEEIKKDKEAEEKNKQNNFNKVNKENNIDYDKAILKSFSLIFDIHKIGNPLFHAAYYDMQYIFWKTVVVGGLIKDLKLSAYFLNISLENNGEYQEGGKDFIIDNNEEVTKIFFYDDEFKKIINQYLTNDNVSINNRITLPKGDLFYAINNATLIFNATKNENDTWNLNITIKDTYDFTDIKNLKQYVDSTDTVQKSLFSSTLNNFAAVSSSYGVIKYFNFLIKINTNDYKIEK